MTISITAFIENVLGLFLQYQQKSFHMMYCQYADYTEQVESYQIFKVLIEILFNFFLLQFNIYSSFSIITLKEQ